eukprot:1132914-Pelagomonas_calceolata.AAC.1
MLNAVQCGLFIASGVFDGEESRHLLFLVEEKVREPPAALAANRIVSCSADFSKQAGSYGKSALPPY